MTRLLSVPDLPVPAVDSIIRRAVADASGADGELLDGYLEMLCAVAVTGRRLVRHELGSRRALGTAAAEQGVPLAAVVDLYLSATWLSWRHLPKSRREVDDDGVTAVLRAANDAIVALADGYQGAQRSAIRHEEAMRGEFIDDLLHGGSDPAHLPERAARFGLQLAGRYAVVVVYAADAFADDDDSSRQIRAVLQTRTDERDVLVTTKEGLLVCVVPGADAGTLARAVHQAAGASRVAVGRAYPAPHGVARSYREARDVLDMAGRLSLDTPVLKAADLLVFQVLFRDREAITDLVATVLAPLEQTRSGAAPLVETLTAYFNTGSAVAAARRLHVGVRTVTYRLSRIEQVTGYHPANPAHRLTLEAAVLGARLLEWPAQPLPA